jgi:hypothetical protein
MPRQQHDRRDHRPPDRNRDLLHVPDRSRNGARPSKDGPIQRADWPPVPDLFDVITYFRARDDSFAIIASIGFWVGETPTKALTARGLKLWYEAELERRVAARAAIR